MIKYLFLILVFVKFFYAQVNIEWMKNYNDTITNNGSSNDHYTILCRSNGNTCVAGICRVYIGGNDYSRFVTILYDDNGNIVWKKNYPENYMSGSISARVHSVNPDNNGNIVLSGYLSNRPILIKYSASGEMLWKKDSTEISDPYYSKSCIDPSGNICWVYIKFVNSSFDIFIKKYDPAGNLLWMNSYNGSENKTDQPYCITTDFQGNIIIGGTENSTSPGQIGKYCVLKYDANGNLLWNRTYAGTLGEAIKVFADGAGNIVSAGTLQTTFPNHEMIVIKYSPAGVQSWASRYSGRPDYLWNETFDMEVDNSGSCFLTGFTEKGFPYSDYVTLKYNSSGILQWSVFYNNSSNQVDIASDVAVDNLGNAYVTGLNIKDSSAAYTTIKYASNGSQSWVLEMDSITNHNTYRYSSLVFENNNIYLTGSLWNRSGIHYDFMLAKYHQVIGIITTSSEIPAAYDLHQNYPNPFNPVTYFEFDIAVKGNVQLIIYDVTGRRISELVNRELEPGSYKADWDAQNYPSGVYFYRLEADGYTDTKKMILIK